MKRALLVLAFGTAVVAGCSPSRIVVTKPIPVPEVRTVVQKVPREACDTGFVTIPEGDLAHAPQVAAQRKALIGQLVERLDGICARHATE